MDADKTVPGLPASRSLSDEHRTGKRSGSPAGNAENSPQRARHPALPWIAALRATGLADDAVAAALTQHCRREPPSRHPLAWLCEALAKYSAKTLPSQELLATVATYCGLQLGEIDRLHLDAATAGRTIPSGFARHHGLLVLSLDDDEAVIACSDPFRVDEWLGELRAALNRRIVPVLAPPQRIHSQIDELYSLHHSLLGAGRDRRLPSAPEAPLLTLPGSAEIDSERHTEVICNWLLRSAVEEQASDIHMEPRGKYSRVRLRIDGSLHTLYRLPSAVALAVCSRLKILAEMDVAECRRPQDGRIRTRLANGEELELRLATLPTAGGEKLVARLLNPQRLLQDLSDLGMDAELLSRWEQITARRSGIALVTGPTGSGKSTTLYAALRRFAGGEYNICTVEDPIEIVSPEFNQTRVRPDLGLDFAACIRALLRQDPDIIMVGEIRDGETAHMAVQAALTGHLVFATLHTGDSVSAIARLLDLGVPAYLLRATLNGVIAQRLLRRICPHCARPAAVDPALWEVLSPTPPPSSLPHARGCPQCRHCGRLGRLAIFELLSVSDSLRTQIGSDATPAQLRQLALQEGSLSPLSEVAAEQVRRGRISIAEAISAL